jgi:hypothetical protein
MMQDVGMRNSRQLGHILKPKRGGPSPLGHDSVRGIQDLHPGLFRTAANAFGFLGQNRGFLTIDNIVDSW